MVVKVRDIIKKLKHDGWIHVGTKGDHRQFEHPTKRGKVTVAGHENDDIGPGTLKSILVQAGWKTK